MTCLIQRLFSVIVSIAAIGFLSPVYGQDTAGMLDQALDRVRQVENPTGSPVTDAQRMDLLTQAIKLAQAAPNHRLKGHRVLAIQAIKSAIAEIRNGDKTKEAVTYLHTADEELFNSISLATQDGSSSSVAASAAPAIQHDDAVSTPGLAPNLIDAFMEAVKQGDLAKVRSLLQATPGLVFGRDKDGATPLEHVAGFGHMDVANLLLADKADVNAKNIYAQTSLHFAEQGDFEDMVELLLAHGAQIDARDKNGETALLDAAQDDSRKVAALLLAKGASVDTRDNSGCTPLIWAAIQGNIELAKLLIASKANVNAHSPMGQNSLNSAAMNGHGNVVELLLAKGADINAKNSSGETALRIAEENHHDDVVNMLRQHGARD